tara:strand:- start:413 stop:874 length:462 start_codon:yes stop_codon:yes gene_type:complete
MVNKEIQMLYQLKKITTNALIFIFLPTCLIIGIGYFHFKKPAEELKSSNSQKPIQTVFYSTIGSDAKHSTRKSTNLLNRYTLEVFAESSEKKAHEKVKYFNKLGFDCFYTPLNIMGKVVYRVRIGVFPNPKSAQIIAKKFIRVTGSTAEIRKL